MKHFLLLLTLIVNANLLVAQTSSPNKRKLVWFDEFNVNGLPDSTKWTYESGFVRNQEPQYYTVKHRDNCRVENGMLVIEARKEEYANAAYKPGSEKWKEEDQSAHYTSASIITRGKKYFKYGRIEVRAKVPKGLGTWPAIWMLGKNKETTNWPDCGEIDMMEFVGKDSTKVHAAIHYSDVEGKFQHEEESRVVGSPADGFHVYALEWYPDRMEFYYDNLRYFVFTTGKVKNSQGSVFKKKFYLLLNLALGRQGAWAGPFNDKDLPFKYYIDYVRVYK